MIIKSDYSAFWRSHNVELGRFEPRYALEAVVALQEFQKKHQFAYMTYDPEV